MENLFQKKFAEAIGRFPDHIAIEQGRESVSYTQFNQIVQSIAQQIVKNNIVNKAIIVINDHSTYTYAGIVAINLTGNVILPVELSWPESRIQDIIQTARPAGFIVKDKNLLPAFLPLKENKGLVVLNNFIGQEQSQVTNMSPIEYKGIAYILFTSGSTGIPKGVPVRQESLDAFLTYFLNEYHFNEEDRFLQVYDITFDVAYFSFMVPLCIGACCCIINSAKGVPRYMSILRDLSERNITVVSMVPTVLHFIKKYLRSFRLETLRYSFFSGDALYHSDAVLWKSCLPNAVLHNFYGPTETTIVCTRYIWEQETSEMESLNNIVPLGTPFPGLFSMIVDENNQEVPTGDKGELAFAGIQVIDQYLDGKYKDKFFYDKKGKKFYKTGDLASLNKNGNLIFHGRTDSQVKINGYRMELPEIEEALSRITHRKVVVIKIDQENHVPFLRAFVEGAPLEVHAINEALKKVIPSYMIPSDYRFVSHFPLNQNSKINKQQLNESIL